MGFPERRRELVDIGFRTFGEPATWDGVSVTIRVRTKDEDDKFGSVSIIDRSTIFRLRSWEPVGPVSGQTVIITAGVNAGEWTVKPGAMLDDKGVWDCPVSKALP